MKYLLIIIAVFIMVMPIMAEEKLNTVQMGDFDRTLQGFSLSNGELVTVDMEEGLPLEIDFIFDMPNGLGMNNSDLAPVFKGTAGIFDLGPVPIDTESDFPEEEFNIFLSPDAIIPGHTYLIQTSNPNQFGKIHILEFDIENELLAFNWVYESQ